MIRHKWSLQARARFVLADMESKGMSCRAACAAAGIEQSAFYQTIRRPKYKELKARFDAIRNPGLTPAGKIRMTNWMQG